MKKEELNANPKLFKDFRRAGFAVTIVLLIFYAITDNESFNPLNVSKAGKSTKVQQQQRLGKVSIIERPDPSVGLPVISLTNGSTAPILDFMKKEFLPDKHPLAFYTLKGSSSKKFIGCGASVSVRYYSPQNLRNTKVYAPEKINLVAGSTNSPSSLASSTLARVKIGEEFAVCNAPITAEHPDHIFADEVTCEFYQTLNTASSITLEPYFVTYFDKGFSSGHEFLCEDKVYLTYEVFSLTEKGNNRELKRLLNGKTKPFLIGYGHVPAQIDKSILDVADGGVFQVQLNSKDIQFISFYGTNHEVNSKSGSSNSSYGNFYGKDKNFVKLAAENDRLLIRATVYRAK